jgi:hypothetical protein
MPLDYGQRRRPRGPSPALWAAGVALAAAVVGGVAFASAIYHRELAAEQGWTTNAPACPMISPEAYRTRYAPSERVTALDDATVARQFGHVMCAVVDAPGWWGFRSHLECQFTSANAIRVKTSNGEAFFEPGPGQVSTISLEPHGVRCALGGKFTLFHDPTNLGPVGPTP